MAKSDAEQPILPSVFDRLIDPEAGNAFKTRAQQLRDLKQNVRRDLQNLLNTRWRCTSWPPDMDDLKLSLVNYGIPDFTGANVNQFDGREELRAVVENVIRKFEPRFQSVHVELLKSDDESDRTLRLKIDAMLYAEPAPEPVVFESQLNPVTSEIRVGKATQ